MSNILDYIEFEDKFAERVFTLTKSIYPDHDVFQDFKDWKNGRKITYDNREYVRVKSILDTIEKFKLNKTKTIVKKIFSDNTLTIITNGINSIEKLIDMVNKSIECEDSLSHSEKKKLFNKVNIAFEDYEDYQRKDIENNLFLFYCVHKKEVEKYNTILRNIDGIRKNQKAMKECRQALKNRDTIKIDIINSIITNVEISGRNNRDKGYLPEMVIARLTSRIILDKDILKDFGTDNGTVKVSGKNLEKIHQYVSESLQEYNTFSDIRLGPQRKSINTEISGRLNGILRFIRDCGMSKDIYSIFRMTESEFIIKFLGINMPTNEYDSKKGRGGKEKILFSYPWMNPDALRKKL